MKKQQQILAQINKEIERIAKLYRVASAYMDYTHGLKLNEKQLAKWHTMNNQYSLTEKQLDHLYAAQKNINNLLNLINY